MESEAAADGEEDTAERLKEAEEETLLKRGAEDYPNTLLDSAACSFSINVLAVACWPGRKHTFVGTGAVTR